jgi:hypothetical protein
MTSLSSHKPKVRLENLAIAFVVLLRVFAVPVVSAETEVTGASHEQRNYGLLPKQQYRMDTDEAKFRSFLSKAEPVQRERLEITFGGCSKDFHKFCGKVGGNRFLDRGNCLIPKMMLPVCLNYVQTRQTPAAPQCASVRIQASQRVFFSLIH